MFDISCCRGTHDLNGTHALSWPAAAAVRVTGRDGETAPSGSGEAGEAGIASAAS